MHITLKSGETIECDHVLVTVSLGVLKAEGHEMFYPPITSSDERKMTAIDDIGG